jgi:hypothetical protein
MSKNKRMKTSMSVPILSAMTKAQLVSYASALRIENQKLRDECHRAIVMYNNYRARTLQTGESNN